MLHKAYKATTPSRRVLNTLTFFDNTPIPFHLKKRLRTNKSYYLSKTKSINFFGLRCRKSVITPQIISSIFKQVSYVTQRFFYDRLVLKELVLLKSIYQSEVVYPSLTTLFPGAVITSSLYVENFSSSLYAINCFTELQNLPYNAQVSYLQNTTHTKFTYALSSGTCCIRLKTKKRYKLLKVKLPSELEIYLTRYSWCIFGKLVDLQKNKLKKGKFGIYWKTNFFNKVRGVAMNPVDHPNGGRTKSKSPEKSPWGWIAKHNC